MLNAAISPIKNQNPRFARLCRVLRPHIALGVAADKMHRPAEYDLIDGTAEEGFGALLPAGSAMGKSVQCASRCAQTPLPPASAVSSLNPIQQSTPPPVYHITAADLCRGSLARVPGPCARIFYVIVSSGTVWGFLYPSH